MVQIVRLIVLYEDLKFELRLIGSRTTETWYNSGDVLSPFAPAQGQIIDAGMGPLEATQFVGGALIVLGSSQDGGAGEAWALTGQDVPVITPAGVSLAWGEYDITSDAYAYTYREAGRWFYVVSFPTAKKTWVYDHTTKMWHRRSHLTPRPERSTIWPGVTRSHSAGSTTSGAGWTALSTSKGSRFFDDAGNADWRPRMPVPNFFMAAP